jgi:hypothetical protein
VERDGKPEKHFDAKARKKNAPRNGGMAARPDSLEVKASQRPSGENAGLVS